MANIIFALVVGVAFVIVAIRPGVACGLILASFSLEQLAQATVPIAAANDALCNYLTAGSVLVGFVTQLTRHGARLLTISAPAVCAGLLLGYCYASIIWSLFPETTAQVLRVQIPYLSIFVGIAPLLVKTIGDLEDALRTLLIAGALSLAGLLLFGTWGTRGVIFLGSKHETNPLALAQTAGAVLIVATVTGQLRKAASRAWLPAAGAIGVTLLLVFLRSSARGQTVAAVGTVAVFTAMRKNKWWPLLAIVGVAALLSAGLFDEEVAKHASRWDPTVMEGELSGTRKSLSQQLLRFWQSSGETHIIFGLGHATAQDQRLLGVYPHVVPVEVLAEEGLVGLVLYLAMLGAGLSYYFIAQRRQSEEAKELVLATLALMVYEFLLTFKQGTLLGAPNFLLLTVVSGSLARLKGTPSVRPSEETKLRQTPLHASHW